MPEGAVPSCSWTQSAQIRCAAMSLLTPMPGMPMCPEAMNGSEAISRVSATTGSAIRNDSRSTKRKRR